MIPCQQQPYETQPVQQRLQLRGWISLPSNVYWVRPIQEHKKTDRKHRNEEIKGERSSLKSNRVWPTEGDISQVLLLILGRISPFKKVTLFHLCFENSTKIYSLTPNPLSFIFLLNTKAYMCKNVAKWQPLTSIVILVFLLYFQNSLK